MNPYSAGEAHESLSMKRECNRWFLKNGARLSKDLITSCDGRVNHIMIFSEEELRKATNNYDKNQILGEDGTFTNYKGIHRDRIVVVRAPTSDNAIEEEQMDFVFNDIVILSQVSHKNVVKLLGCCLETQVPLLVYEFVSKGNLDLYIHEFMRFSNQISWRNRLKIAYQIAYALTYLHTSTSRAIVHRDVKLSNILVDEFFNAKLAKFRIATPIHPDERHVDSDIKGSLGRIDPQYACSGKFTEKSDVFGFGLVLLELLTGKEVLDRSWDHVRLGDVLDRSRDHVWLGDLVISSMNDECLYSVLDSSILEEEMRGQFMACAKLAERCTKGDSEQRPTMKEVVQELKLLY